MTENHSDPTRAAVTNEIPIKKFVVYYFLNIIKSLYHIIVIKNLRSVTNSKKKNKNKNPLYSIL